MWFLLAPASAVDGTWRVCSRLADALLLLSGSKWAGDVLWSWNSRQLDSVSLDCGQPAGSVGTFPMLNPAEFC